MSPASSPSCSPTRRSCCCGGATCCARPSPTSSPSRPAAGARSPGSTGQPVGEPVYDREAIDRRLGQVVYEQARWREFLARLGSRSGLPFAELAYEDLVRDWDGVLGPLLAGLVGDGFDGVVPAPRLRRQSDARTERILLRYLEDSAGRRAPALAAR